MDKHAQRGQIYWVKLDPTIGTEMKKTRPCVILSNNSQNKKLSRVIVAPITSSVTNIYSFEAKIRVKNLDCKVCLDQLRSVDSSRLLNLDGVADSNTMIEIEKCLKLTLGL